VRKAVVAACALAALVVSPLAASYYVRRIVAATFNSNEGRKSTDQAIRAAVALLGREYSVTSAPPLAQGLTVGFPSINVERQGKPWLEFTRTQLSFAIWPHILSGKIGIRLQARDTLSQATIELSAAPALGILTRRTRPADAPTEVSIQAKDVRLRTWLEAFNINLAGTGPLAMPVDCCSAAMQVKGTAMIASWAASAAQLEFQLKYPRVKLPRRLGLLRLKDFALPVRYESTGWVLGQPVETVAEGQYLKIGLNKESVGDPLHIRLSGSSPVVEGVSVAAGCAIRGDSGVRLTWRTGLGWGC